MLLEHIVGLFDAKQINEELDTIIIQLDMYEAIKVDPIDNNASYKQLMSLVDKVITQFTAARKAMGIVNTIKDPEYRKKHKSKVMGNMNRLRGLVSKLDKAIAKNLGGKTPVTESFDSIMGDVIKNNPDASSKEQKKIANELFRSETRRNEQKANLKQKYKKARGRKDISEAVKAKKGNLRNMDKDAQAVWAAKGIESKKAAMNTMINNFKAKKKQATFRARLEKLTSVNAIDTMAGNVMLSDSDAVVR